MKIAICDEQSDEVISSGEMLDLASDDIGRMEYEDYDLAVCALPRDRADHEFTSGTLSHNGKDVEFRIDVNKTTGQYSVSATELLEIKLRAAALFAGMTGKDMLGTMDAKSGSGKAGRLH